MAFKLSLVADVRPWLKGTADVEKSLDDLAGGLDDLARDTKQSADKAGDQLERKFSDAFDAVKKESRTASRKLGDDIKDGTKEAGEGFDDLKDEANQSAKEAAASFTGEFEDVADYIQEVLAQALSGFGPMGAAAGIAAAAGVGILIGELQKSAEKAKEATEAADDLADELNEAKGNPAAINWLERIRTLGKEITDNKDWYEFWQPNNTQQWDAWNKLAKEASVTQAELGVIMRAQAGDITAQSQALDILTAARERSMQGTRTWVDAYGGVHTEMSQSTKDIDAQIDKVKAQGESAQRAAEQNRVLAAAKQRDAEAAAKAQESNDQFAESLRDNGSVLDDFAGKIIRGGKIIYSEWERLRKKMRGDNKLIMEVDADPRLSPAARENFRNLPREVQTAIAKEFKKGGKADDKVVKELNADAKVKVGKIDVQTPQVKPIEVPTTVNDDGAVKGAQAAADSAQKVANREANKIEFKTKVNDDGLQAAVNRAAAAIRPPTIWVNVKAKKEVP